MDKTRDIIRDIGRYLTDKKLYKSEHDAEVFKLEPQGLETQARNMMTNRDIRDVPVT
jgi:hypothetical protein